MKFPILNLERPTHIPANSVLSIVENGKERRGSFKTAITINSLEQVREIYEKVL